MLVKGDKIKVVKQMGMLGVGEVCEVTNIEKDGIITFSIPFLGKTIIFGCMSYNEYEKYFEKVIKREWSDWYNNDSHSMRVFEESIKLNLLYRNNGKVVEIKTYYLGKTLKAKAICCKEDEFDLETGLDLAKKRLCAKILNTYVENFAKNM